MKRHGVCDLMVLEKKGMIGKDRKKLIDILEQLDIETI